MDTGWAPGIRGDCEQAEEVGRRRGRDRLDVDPAQARDLPGDVAHPRRLVALAAPRDRREVGAVGLDQHPLEGDALRDLLQLDGVPERDDAGERDVEAELHRLLGDLPGLGEAVHHSTDFGGTLLAHDREGVGGRRACVDDERPAGFARGADVHPKALALPLEVALAVVLNERMEHETETLLMFAARREHIVRTIAPALARGDWVLCDRYTDATWAYQGGGHGVSAELIAALEREIVGDVVPDVTLLFDVPEEVSRERRSRARIDDGAVDKFEREPDAFFERVRAMYRARAAADPARFRMIDASRPVADVRAELQRIVDAVCAPA